MGWAHLTFGVAFALLALVHVGRHRRVYLAVLRQRRRRAVVSAVLVASAVVMTVSGAVQWAGVTAAIPWHGASSMLLILLGAGHAAWPCRSPCRRLGPSTDLRRPATASPVCSLGSCRGPLSSRTPSARPVRPPGCHRRIRLPSGRNPAVNP